MRNVAHLFLAAALASPGVSAARPAPKPACAPVVRDAWVRMTPTMPMGAGYFTLVNPCRVPAVVVAARSDAFANVSMHETRIEAGVSRMHPLQQVRVEAGGRVAFEPGARHLMLMSPRSTLAPGARVPLRLEFADGRRVDVVATVRAPTP